MRNFFALLCLLTSFSGAARAEALLIRNARLLTMKDAFPENGSVLVQDGKIKKVAKSIDIQEGALVLDAQGAWLTPGLFDSNTRLGLVEIDLESLTRDDDDATQPLTPQLFVLDAYNPASKAIAVTRRYGVTSALVAPSDGNLIPGQSAVMKLVGDLPSEAFVARGGLHVTLGETPKARFGGRGQAPSTRMGEAALLRQAFLEARHYMERKDKSAKTSKPKDGKNESQPDLAKEAMAAALRTEIPVIVSAHRMDDIMTALRLQDEFGFRMILSHGTEAHRVAAELARRKIPVLAGPVRTSPSTFEKLGATLESSAVLHKAGVKIAFQTDEVHNVRNLPFEAAYAAAYGMPEDAALRAITLTPAEIFGVENRLGSIEPGKDADLVLWSGYPLKVRSVPTHVWIGGKAVYPQ
jgi:imidazolonepropionase-like amidohydrolase